MHILRQIGLLVSMIVMVAYLGCHSDPNVRKQKYLESGNRYFEQEQYHEAIIEYLNATKADPKFAKAHYQLAETYIRLQIWPDAYRELKRTVELDPTNIKAQVELGNLLGAAHSFEEAQAIADKLLRNNPDNPEVYILLANLKIAQGDTESGKQEVQRAIALDPKRPDFYVQMAALQSSKNTDAAEASLNNALAVNPNFVPALESLAALYQNSGRPGEAENLLKKAITADPRNAKARRSLAQFYYAQNRKTEAEQVMLQAKKDLGGEKDFYRILGEYYNNVGEGNKALAEFAAISKDHPKDVKTKEDYIRLLLANRKSDEAGRLNDTILKDNPRDTGAQIIRATMLNSQGKFDEATGILESALKDAPENAYGHYQLGLAMARTGNLTRAEQEWREAAKLAPQINDVQFALAQVARMKGDAQLLRDVAEQFIQNRPADPRGYIMRAESEGKAKNISVIQADLERAIQVAPESPLGYLAMGDFWRNQKKNTEQARQYYEKALDRDPGFFEPLAALAAMFMRDNQNARALQRVQAQAEKVPNSDQLYMLLGGLQVANKDLTSAEKSLQRAIQLNPDNSDAFALLSKIEMALGQGDRALATAYKSIERNSRNVSAYFFAGILEELSGRPQKAEEAYRKALQLAPTYGPAANNLAYLMLQNGENADVALSLAQIARQKMPDSPNAADTLAWVYYRKGVYGMAAGLLEEALQKAPDNLTYHYHIGMVYQKQNKRAEARKHLRRALELNPNAPVAGEIRKTLNQIG